MGYHLFTRVVGAGVQTGHWLTASIALPPYKCPYILIITMIYSIDNNQ